MKQVEIAKELGVSKAYISMVLSGKKKASKRVEEELDRLKVNQKVNQYSISGSVRNRTTVSTDRHPPTDLKSAMSTRTHPLPRKFEANTL